MRPGSPAGMRRPSRSGERNPACGGTDVPHRRQVRPIYRGQRHDDRLRAAVHAELVEDHRQLVAHRLLALAETLGDRAVVEPLGDEVQNRRLGGRQAGIADRARLLRPGPARGSRRARPGTPPRPARPAGARGSCFPAARSARRGSRRPACSLRRTARACRRGSARSGSGRAAAAARSSTSMPCICHSSCAATSAVAVTRSRSPHQRCCSGVPSGMKRLVKNWQNAGLSRPQPMRMKLTSVSGLQPLGVGLGASPRRPGRKRSGAPDAIRARGASEHRQWRARRLATGRGGQNAAPRSTRPRPPGPRATRRRTGRRHAGRTGRSRADRSARSGCGPTGPGAMAATPGFRDRSRHGSASAPPAGSPGPRRTRPMAMRVPSAEVQNRMLWLSFTAL